VVPLTEAAVIVCMNEKTMRMTTETSESEEYRHEYRHTKSYAFRETVGEYDKKDKDMEARDAGQTQEYQDTAKVHAAGSSHCGEIKSKDGDSRNSTRAPHRSGVAFLRGREGRQA
jgi:hypothetical protein